MCSSAKPNARAVKPEATSTRGTASLAPNFPPAHRSTTSRAITTVPPTAPIANTTVATLRVEAVEDPNGVSLIFSTDDATTVFSGRARIGDTFSGQATARLRVATFSASGPYRFVYDCWHR